MAYIFKHYSKTTPTGTGIVFTAYKLPSYSITYNLTNLTSDATNPATIGIGETASIRITAPTGYNLPSRITVTGCEYTWEANTGVLNISNPTGNVTIAAEGVAETYSVTVRLTGVTGESTNPTTVSYGGSATFKFTANENYELPVGVEQTGATSYNWNKATGTLVLTNITGPVTVTITGVATTPQLATPQNVTADGTTVSWDEVENATSYDILADGVSIGTVENQNGYSVALTCDSAGRVSFNYSIDNMSADLIIQLGETKNIIVTEYLFIRSRGATPEVVSYSGGVLEATGGFGRWKFTPTQNNSTITVVDND